MLINTLKTINLQIKMFNLFKKKSEKEKLSKQYKDTKKKAYEMSTINRKESDRLEKEANDILLKIEELEKLENQKKSQ